MKKNDLVKLAVLGLMAGSATLSADGASNPRTLDTRLVTAYSSSLAQNDPNANQNSNANTNANANQNADQTQKPAPKGAQPANNGSQPNTSASETSCHSSAGCSGNSRQTSAPRNSRR